MDGYGKFNMDKTYLEEKKGRGGERDGENESQEEKENEHKEMIHREQKKKGT